MLESIDEARDTVDPFFAFDKLKLPVERLQEVYTFYYEPEIIDKVKRIMKARLWVAERFENDIIKTIEKKRSRVNVCTVRFTKLTDKVDQNDLDALNFIPFGEKISIDVSPCRKEVYVKYREKFFEF